MSGRVAAIGLLLSWMLAAIFVAAGLYKLFHLRVFVSLASYMIKDFVERPWSEYAACALPVIELGVGALLIVPRYRRTGGWCAALLLSWFSVMLAWHTGDERLSDCGCSWPLLLGFGFKTVDAMVVRNVLLIACSVFAACGSKSWRNFNQRPSDDPDSLAQLST